MLLLLASQALADTASGVVFHDRNGDGRFDKGDKPLKGIKVSNGRAIVQTDGKGRYALPVGDDAVVFVLKPKGWRTPLDENNLPQFYYLHKPAGSPRYEYAGIEPTGPLPASVDFALYPQREPEQFRAVLFADPQPRDQHEIDYMAHDVVEELIGIDASFGVTLGDVLFDDLSLFGSINRTVGLVGIPWYNVVGNHDINFDAPVDSLSNETFRSVYGPPYYSFDYGPVHFVVLDDVEWRGAQGDERGSYRGGLGEAQMEFIRRDLALIPKKQLVVLFMHIPLTQIGNRQELYRLIEQRPFSLSVSGHTHYQQHVFIGEADGWQGAEPHHHVINVTVSGSWWRGAPDERGIPHATMRDGAPNGYSIIAFDGEQYAIDFKAASAPADEQMSIYAPQEVSAAVAQQSEIVVNFYGGSERAVVEMRLGDEGTWRPMQYARRHDPYFAALKKLEGGEVPPSGRPLPGIINSSHIWQAPFPANPPVGTHLIEVRIRDMYGRAFADQRIVRVVP